MPRVSSVLLAFSLAIAAGGCQTTDPLSAASIDYRLPRTDAVAQLSLTLEDCTETGFEVSAELALAAKPGAEPVVWRVPGAALASVRIKRGLQISVSEDGVITGINSTSSDQTAAIVVNAIKTVSSAASLIAAPSDVPTKGPAELTCLPEVVSASRRVKIIRMQIAYLRAQLANSSVKQGPTADDLKQIREVNTLARELAALRTGLLLVHTKGLLALSKDVQNSPETVRDVTLVSEPFEKWFGPSEKLEELVNQYFGLKWNATLKENVVQSLDLPDGKFRSCGLSVRVPQVRPVEVAVAAAPRSNLGSLTAKEVMPVAQWSDPASLCVDVGFGESRSVVLAFDKYGRTKDFNWSSEATGAVVSGAIAGSSADITAFANASRGHSELERRKAKIDELETQKKLNELLACQTVIDAGGFACAKAEEP